MLHYLDAKNDLSGTVRKIADFVGVELTNEEHEEVTRRCDIKHMKTIPGKFDYVQWAGDGTPVMCGKSGCPGMDGSLIRNGKNGEGNTFFTKEMKEVWDAAIEAEFTDLELRQWAKKGGSFS